MALIFRLDGTIRDLCQILAVASFCVFLGKSNLNSLYNANYSKHTVIEAGPLRVKNRRGSDEAEEMSEVELPVDPVNTRREGDVNC